MTYHKYGIIDAATYNDYAGIINTIYADTNVGSTIETTANFGYGQSSAISPVAIGSNITAAEWTNLFTKITDCGTHQGTNVYPIPSSVSAGSLISAYNDYLTTQTLTDVIGKLNANRLLVNVSQLSLIAGPTSPSSPSWVGCLQYNFQIDFGSWDNARHFFNTGGSIVLSGTGTGSTAEDIFWSGMLTGMGSLKFNWHNTVPVTGPGSNSGFYDLTSTYKEVYRRSPVNGGIYYSNNYISIDAKLGAVAPTSGVVDFIINLIDNDPSPLPTTAGTLTFNVGLIQSSGVIPYTGPAVINNAGTYSVVSNTPFPGVALTLTSSVETLSASIVGAGIATTPSITITPAGGTPPYTYLWSNESGIIDTFTPSASSATVTFSKSLVDGEIAIGTAKCLVTDSTSLSEYMPINWSMNSNRANTQTP